MKASSKNDFEKPLLPSVPFNKSPIESSRRVLRHKWTLLVLRNVGFLNIERFNEMLGVTPGLTPRVLSKRHADNVFEDKKPRTLEELFPQIITQICKKN